jgi:Tfp pilus assembly protein PilF
MDMGDKKKAMETLLSILKRNPQNVPALSMLGLAYLNGGQLERARLCFEEEVRLKPQMDTGHLNLGTTYKRMGKIDLAEKEYRAALALSPRMPEAISNLAQILLAQERKKEAGDILESAVSSGIEGADIYFEMGVLAAMNSQWDRAKYAFSKVISMDPRRDEAFANLGKVAFQQGKVDEAISYYQRAIRVAPRDSSYLATLGSLYLNGKNDPSQALSYFRRALAAHPYGPEAHNLRELIQTLQGSQE